MKIIGHIYTDFPEKFGIPRQSGLFDTPGYVVFEPPYNNPDAVRGLEEFSHIWLIWQLSECISEKWSPTIRPPRLGGNIRVGVFASRSPFRPNPIGLSCVELEKIEFDKKRGPILHVKGVDILNGTPLYDVKPYLAYTDAKIDAKGGFAERVKDDRAAVFFEPGVCGDIDKSDVEMIEKLLSHDPRPHYQLLKEGNERTYGMAYKNYEVKFIGQGEKIIVKEIVIKKVGGEESNE